MPSKEIPRVSVKGGLTVLGGALASLLPIVGALYIAKNEKGEPLYDIKAAVREKFDEALSSTPILNEREAVSSWERAREYADAGDLIAAGRELLRLEELMSQRNITPKDLKIEAERSALCRRAAEAYVDHAMSLVEPDEKGTSPYAQTLNGILTRATDPSPSPTSALMHDHRLSDPRVHLITAKNILASIGESLDLKPLRSFVKGTLRDDYSFAYGAGPATQLGRSSIQHMYTTGVEFSPRGASEAFGDEETKQNIKDLMDCLWKAAQENVQQGDPDSAALQNIVLLCRIGREIGLPEEVQQTIDSMDAVTDGMTMEENLLSTLTEKFAGAEDH